MRSVDQPVILEWFPHRGMTPVKSGPLDFRPERKQFATIDAAVEYAVLNLSERDMPEIRTLGGDIFGGWDYIKACGAILRARS